MVELLRLVNLVKVLIDRNLKSEQCLDQKLLISNEIKKQESLCDLYEDYIDRAFCSQKYIGLFAEIIQVHLENFCTKY